MKFLEEHQLKITTLTPVHIGCGENYTPTDYVIDDKTLFAFDSSAVIEALTEKAREKMMRLVSGSRQDDVLKEIQRFFYEHRESLMAKSSHYLPVASGVDALYENRIGQAAQGESGGKTVINKLEIERTFYNPVNQAPVIPGSSLKGAIRTALLNQVNIDKKQPFNGRRPIDNKKLQQCLFEYEMGKLEKDPMRLVCLADSTSTECTPIKSEIRFAVNRPREPTTNRTMAEDKGLYQLLETLPELNARAYSSRLTIQKVRQLPQKDKLPTDNFHWNIKQIIQACNEFYRPLLKKEMDIIKQRQYVSPDWANRMEKLFDGIKSLLDTERAMLLRVGRHSGAEAVTLNLKMGGQPKPRTLWLAADAWDSSSGMAPFGWLLIEIDPSDTPTPILENLIKQSDDSKQEWLKKQQSRMVELQEKLIRRKQARLAEQQAEREKQQRLASMTEEARAIEELKAWFEQDQDNKALTKQGRVPRRLHELLTSATDWPLKYRIELCALAEEIYGSLGMLKGKNGKERKAQIQKLRESVLQ